MHKHTHRDKSDCTSSLWGLKKPYPSASQVLTRHYSLIILAADRISQYCVFWVDRSAFHYSKVRFFGSFSSRGGYWNQSPPAEGFQPILGNFAMIAKVQKLQWRRFGLFDCAVFKTSRVTFMNTVKKHAWESPPRTGSASRFVAYPHFNVLIIQTINPHPRPRTSEMKPVWLSVSAGRLSRWRQQWDK